MNALKLALRNVIRDWRRSLVTGSAMALASLVMILYTALINGMLASSERNVTRMDLGMIQIHQPGYREDPDLYTVIKQPGVIIDSIHLLGLAATPRLYGFGLAASGSSSAAAQLRGVDITAENKVTDIHKHLASGEWISEDHSHGVVLGKRLARNLSLKVGDEVIVISQAADGSTANDLYRVRGILQSIGSQVDEAGLFMPEDSFRELMGVETGAHEIAIRAPDDKAQDLETLTREISNIAPGEEVMNWKQLQPVIASILDSANSQTIFMLLLIYTAVALVILNAELMSVFDRIQQFGVMRAIGVTPWQVIRQVVAETLLITTIAAALAIGFGLPGMHWLAENGIDLSKVAGDASFAGVAIDPIWRAEVSADSVLYPILFLYLIALIASFYPASKAARIDPLEAIHYR